MIKAFPWQILRDAGLPDPDGLNAANWRGTPLLTRADSTNRSARVLKRYPLSRCAIVTVGPLESLAAS